MRRQFEIWSINSKEQGTKLPRSWYRQRRRDGWAVFARVFRITKDHPDDSDVPRNKLSAGVDARNIHNIILMRPVNSLIEFKSRSWGGTGYLKGKSIHHLWVFVDAYHDFADPEWDGEPIDETTEKPPKSPTPPEDQWLRDRRIRRMSQRKD